MPVAAELTTNVNSDYLITVSSNGRDEVMRYHCWRYIALVLICHKTTNKQILTRDILSGQPGEEVDEARCKPTGLEVLDEDVKV